MADKLTIAGASEGSFTESLSVTSDMINQIRQNGNLSNKDDAKKFNEMIKLLKENNAYRKLDEKDRKTIQKQLNHYDVESAKQWAKQNASFEKLASGLTSIFGKLETHIKTYSQYSIKVSAALEGTQKTYATAVQNLTNAIGSTGLAKMSDVLNRMSELTSKGIVANAEQNAFLDTISEGISSVFNSANGTLLRLIKLQGEDSTVNRLVMQASLKEYLNQTYQNSQYLYEKFQDVSDSLVEATSLLTSSLSLSLESTVQKWMGSLSSLGLSTGAVDKFSSALGAVGSGNLRGIDQNMQNLVIMGANRAGLSYSDLLTGGLSAEQTDRLMYGMISYLGGLQGNNVVLSEYANLFGMNVSDLVAARNAQGQLGTIMGANISTDANSLSDYLNKYNQYLNQSPATLYDTLFENMLFGMGANVANDRLSYGMYKGGGLLANIGSTIGSNSNGWIGKVVGGVASTVGLGAQLASALGITSGNAGNTIKGLYNSVTNLWNNPDAIAAYNLLAGTNYSLLSMGAGLGARGAKNIVDVSSSSSSGGSAFTSGGGTSVDIDQTWAEAEEAASARTADDIYEFLSDDVVTVTPYIGENDVLGNIETYNMQIANNTSAIFTFLHDKLGPYLLISSIDEISSIRAALEAGSQDEDLAALGTSYNEWKGRF